MINCASNKIIKNICDTRESLYLPSKFGTHCCEYALGCDKTVVYIFASSLLSSITLCYGFTVLMYFSHSYLFVEAGTESHKRDKAKHQVQGKMTCVRLKDQSKLKNKTITC